METAIAPPVPVEPDLEEAEAPTQAERDELLAQELREAIRRKVEPRAQMLDT